MVIPTVQVPCTNEIPDRLYASVLDHKECRSTLPPCYHLFPDSLPFPLPSYSTRFPPEDDRRAVVTHSSVELFPAVVAGFCAGVKDGNNPRFPRGRAADEVPCAGSGEVGPDPPVPS